MDGETESLATSRFQKLKTKVEEFETSVGLPPQSNDIDECEHLNLAGEDLRKLSAERCDEIGLDLTAYAVYIQRILGKQQAYLKWCDTKINMAIADELNNYSGYYSNEMRRAKAILNNEYAKQLEELRSNCQIKVSMLEQLPFQINQMYRMIMEAKNTKLKSR